MYKSKQMPRNFCGRVINQKLKFNKDGIFKIVQLADLHYEPNDQIIAENQKITKSLLESERPDLVVFSGDMISGWALSQDKFEGLFEKMHEPLIQMGIPWASILGNHDREGELKPKDLLCLDSNSSELSYTLNTEVANGNNELDYILPIYSNDDTEVQAWIILMDSGYTTCDGKFGGGCVDSKQVNWLKQTFKPSLHQNKITMYFQHQPIPQYNDLYYNFDTFGSRHEATCSPLYDTGVYKVLSEQKNVHSVLVGHDHNNDFVGRLVKDGREQSPQLAYGRKTGYGGYGPAEGIVLY
jgi:3',5'-cyclic AMP phosphodiesterase CpdA